MVLERYTRTSLQNPQKDGLRTTRTCTTGLQKTIYPSYRRFSLRRGRRTLTRGRNQPLQTFKTQTSPTRIFLGDLYANGKKLRRLRKRTISRHQSFGSLENPLRLDPQTNQNRHGPC